MKDNRFLALLDAPERSKKPRMKGVTMVLPVEPHPISENILEGYSEYIDIVKVLDREMWAPESFVMKCISEYRRHGLDVQFGGLPFEIARLLGKEEELLAYAKKIGVNVIEYETHVAKSTVDEMREGVRNLKKQGFKVVGEVGSKWFWKDETRKNLAGIDIGKTIEHFSTYVDAGCSYVYWEGRVVVNLIGRNLDNSDGQKQLLDVVKTIGAEKILFEVWGPEMTLRSPAKYWSWLVSKFGPDISVGNVVPEAIAFLESCRRGVTYEMDHPYLRWLEEKKPVADWWSMPPPPYSVYV